MKYLICGDRKWGEADAGLPMNRAKLMYKAMKAITPADHVLEGEAAGADKMCRIICELRDIPFTPFPADWCDFGPVCGKQPPHQHHGKQAGMLRNRAMIAADPDEVWAFHDDLRTSKGTISTVRLAWKEGIPVKWFSPRYPGGVVLTNQNFDHVVSGARVPDLLDEVPF